MNKRRSHYKSPKQRSRHYKSPKQRSRHYKSPKRRSSHYKSPKRRSSHYKSPKRRSSHYKSPKRRSRCKSQTNNILSQKKYNGGNTDRWCECLGGYFRGKRDKAVGEACSCNYDCESHWCRRGLWGCGGWFGAEPRGKCTKKSDWNYLSNLL